MTPTTARLLASRASAFTPLSYEWDALVSTLPSPPGYHDDLIAARKEADDLERAELASIDAAIGYRDSSPAHSPDLSHAVLITPLKIVMNRDGRSGVISVRPSDVPLPSTTKVRLLLRTGLTLSLSPGTHLVITSQQSTSTPTTFVGVVLTSTNNSPSDLEVVFSKPPIASR